MKKKIVVFVGPPGSGKGSLSQLCVDRLGWKQLSTGALCRHHIATQTAIGKKIDFAIKSGKLINDEYIIQMVGDWIASIVDSAVGIILDGFPRTISQARILKQFVHAKDTLCQLYVIRLTISNVQVIQRLSQRRICENKTCQRTYSLNSCSKETSCAIEQCNACSGRLVCRKDDVPSVVRDRLVTYYENEEKLINFFDEMGYSILDINAHEPLEKVYKNFLDIVDIKGES